MASERPHRATAGRNISTLIEQEETRDEFYTTAYGGFDEASEDNEYQSEDEDEDVVDSDFDLSERGGSGEDEEAILQQTKQRKRKWVQYNQKKSTTGTLKAPTIFKRRKKEVVTSIEPYEPRSLRQSTLDFTQERSRIEELKQLQKQTRQRRSHSSTKKVLHMTQEQLLEEAKWTEVANLASLEAHTRLQAQKKSYKTKDHSISGPLVRYHSVTMPVLKSEESAEGTQTYSRNFLVFTDTNSVPNSYFSREQVQKPKQLYCKVTGLPAKYIDPLTKFPYSTAHAFRVIRDRFVKEKEDKCEERLQQLSDWLEEKKRLKKQSR